MRTIGGRLREERERLGLNQVDFSAIGGVGKAAQIAYERGDRSPDAAYLVALGERGVDLMYVLTGVRTKQAATPLTAEEAEVLEQYARAGEEGRAAVRTVLAALVQSATKR